MKYILFGLGALTTISPVIIAKTPTHPTIAQPTTCISADFSATGNEHWKSIVLKLTNNCDQAADFQNSTINFKTTAPLNTSFWGNFSPLPYPDNTLNISSQPQGNGEYLASLTLHFPTYPGSNTKLPAGSSFTIQYGASSDNHINNSTNVYLSDVVGTGNIQLTNSSLKPANVTQNYALVHMTMNGQSINDVQLPWSSSKTITGLAAGSYAIFADSITSTDGNNYQATVVPNTINLNANQTAGAVVGYAKVPQTGKLSINLQALPSELTGYTLNPSVVLRQTATGSSQSQTVTWGNSVTVSQLKDGATYTFSTAPIRYNDYNCQPIFSPISLIASGSPVPVTNLTYQCIQVVKDSITIEVNGAPESLSSLKVTLTPNDNSAAIANDVDLINGTGSSIVALPSGAIYTVSANSVSGYSMSFSPQPLTAAANAKETITLTANPQVQGRIIGYLPGWKTPPSAQALVNAGYTHVMVAFGVFSSTVPGQIVAAFDTVTKAYIQTLHQQGIKVILSLGGASTSLPNTTVDFHQVLAAASSPDAFKQTFISSLNQLIDNYDFDGFDIDIEHGINGGGTLTNPIGDISVLASIINTMYAQDPTLLITLTPQTANISATRGFDSIWANYASLIMQTHDSLAWVGIQLYNTGCMYGIDLVCYAATPTTTPNFSVAMATDLLESWPERLANGTLTGFQPYISYLKPSQVVLGYPAPNASGASDGSPVTPTSTIKRAIQCLKTASAGNNSCGTYIPPKAYGNIGGVFNWELTYDQNNNFKFATELRACVLSGVCG